MQRLPILDIVKHALSLPFSKPLEFLKTIGLFFIASIVALVFAGVFAGAGLVDPVALENLESNIAAGSFSGIAAILPMFLVMAAVVGWVFAYTFNYWVRAGAFGFEYARIEPFSDAFKAAAVNMLKFLAIFILLGIISFVLMSVMGTLKLSASFGDQMDMAAQQDIASMTRAGMLNQIIMTLISCGVYSHFSANLTQTAVGSDHEGLDHPHKADFAIVLVLLYAVLLVPVTIAGLMGSMMLMQVLNLVLGLLIMFAIAVAHGLRYRVCVAENQHETEV